MGFRLANVDGRAALVHGAHYTDLATHSQGMLGPAHRGDVLNGAYDSVRARISCTKGFKRVSHGKCLPVGTYQPVG